MLRIIVSFFYLIILNTKLLAFDHSHTQFDKIIKANLHFKGKQGLFDYKGLKKNENNLKDYLAQLSQVTRKEFNKFNKSQQLAFLINAYNAFTIQVVLNHYPVESIKDIGSFFKSVWKKKFFTLFGKEAHLDHIEHGIIRKEFNEPRIHFAVNCASMGCPSLYKEAYIALKLDQQLENATKHFLQNKKKNYYDSKSKVLYLSKIFDWYEDDFIKKYGSVKKFVSKYLLSDEQAEIKIKYLNYDWSLNEYHK